MTCVLWVSSSYKDYVETGVQIITQTHTSTDFGLLLREFHRGWKGVKEWAK